jgi:hypothetical protein
MANTLLTISMITRESLRLFKNTNSFIQHVDKQYDDSYAVVGAKIGNALRIRLPNDYTIRTGQAAQPQDTTEQQTTLTLATQQGVDLAFTSADRTLSLDDFSRRVLAPAINNLVGAVALNVMTGVNGGAARFVANVDSNNNILTPTVGTWTSAGAILDTNSAPTRDRNLVLHPLTMGKVIPTLAGLLNPAPRISEQYEDSEIKGGLGFTWFKDQTVLARIGGSFSAGTVNGANQSGLVLTTNAITGTLNIGDIITIAGVNMVNRITKQDTGLLQQFVITAQAPANAVALSIYPALVGPTTLPNGTTTQSQYQTVLTLPANGAVISLVNPASTQYRANLAFVPEAVILVSADLELPEGVANAARERYDDISMRMVSAYDIRDDVYFTRLDILYGWLWVRPEWVVQVADNTSAT